MEKHEWLAQAFEAERSHLQAVAYRMLGSFVEADDAVQEAWLHLSRADASSVKNLDRWLTTVVARICLDMLRARKVRREESLEAAELELDPSHESVIDPEQEAMLADSVGLALLVILDTLSPAERLAFVLHDIFAMPFEEIAPIVERSEMATRQLASRARRRVRDAPSIEDANLTRNRDVIEAFLAASRAGNFEALLALLDPDVVYRHERAAPSKRTPGEIRGALAVAKQLLRGHARAVQTVLVNGVPGVVVAPAGRLLAVATFTVTDGKITLIDVISDPAHLNCLHLAMLPDQDLA